MGLASENKEGNTFLSIEELEMLIPPHITTRQQLDEAEQDNIEDAIQWAFSLRTIKPKKLFSSEFQDILHKKMLNKVWKWAGEKRTKETNIGINPINIAIERKKLNEDALFWFNNNVWPSRELALRFHHRLVQIHCYPNGNGRHARILADLLLDKLYKTEPLQWVTKDLITENESRKTYLRAMKVADEGDYTLLIKCIQT